MAQIIADDFICATGYEQTPTVRILPERYVLKWEPHLLFQIMRWPKLPMKKSCAGFSELKGQD